MQGPRMCVYREDHWGTAKIYEGIAKFAIIMHVYFAEIKANEQQKVQRNEWLG